MRAGLNLLISGGTGSGKTTTLNAIASQIPAGQRVITIEETKELALERHLEDCIALEGRFANLEGVGEIRIRELVRQALRMRPVRIIVGEVRGPEALDMLNAMNSGHEGSMGTIHANSARQALTKLHTYTKMAEEALSDAGRGRHDRPDHRPGLPAPPGPGRPAGPDRGRRGGRGGGRAAAGQPPGPAEPRTASPP